MQRPSKSAQKIDLPFSNIFGLQSLIWCRCCQLKWRLDQLCMLVMSQISKRRGCRKMQQKLDSCIFAASKCVLKNTFYEFQISKLHDNRDNLWPKKIWIRRKIFRFHPLAKQDGKRLETQKNLEFLHPTAVWNLWSIFDNNFCLSNVHCLFGYSGAAFQNAIKLKRTTWHFSSCWLVQSKYSKYLSIHRACAQYSIYLCQLLVVITIH